ncbi:glucokinase [Synechocystis sp. LKSZ1]|uniref:glucokinase n=1 Tax=Synechocystis sp. LKSZ1 TaxID=3144951 RepID=UPI00336BC2FC
MAHLLLAGDIGGTKTSLRLLQSQPNSDQLLTLGEATYSSQAFPDLIPLVQIFLQRQPLTSIGLTISGACFGIAGPVLDNCCELTNLNWFLQGDILAATLGIPQVTLINDFTAVAYGLGDLTEQDLFWLQSVPAQPMAPMALIGAGTGLGQGFLIPQANGGYQVFASEGGHADFPARTPLEFELVQDIRRRYQLERVSIERIVSGLGIGSIYYFLREKYPHLEGPALKQAWQAGEFQDNIPALVARVAQLALENNNDLARQAMTLFIEAYGAEAGNLSLKLLPYGGLYIAGGIAPKILPLLTSGRFMQVFLAKGRMQGLLEQIPVAIVLNEQVGLMGAGRRAAQLLAD